MNNLARPRTITVNKPSVDENLTLDMTKNNTESCEDTKTEVVPVSAQSMSPAEERRKARKEARRLEGAPFGKRDVLNFPKRKGYIRRVVNDVKDGDRVKDKLNDGWEFVREANIDGGDKRAGADSQLATNVTRSVGGGVKGVLMEIPEDWYREDQAEKQKYVDKTDESIKKKKRTAENAAADGMYGEVTIDRS